MARTHIKKAGVALLAALVVFQGCTLVVSSTDISRLRLGMTPDQAVMYLDRTPVIEHRFENGPGRTTFLAYYLRRADERPYFLVFSEDSLLFWGYPEECATSEIPGVAAGARRVQEALKEK